jgi:hypothetical protein
MSFYGPNLEKYTSYRAHPTAEGAVQQLLFTEKGILSISKWSIHFAIRRGLTQWHLTYVWDPRGGYWINTRDSGALIYTLQK